MAKQAGERPEIRCPVYELLEKLSGKGKGCADFVDHLKKAHVEVLLAIRGLIDERVEQLQKKGNPKGGRSRRIKVTEKD